MTVTLEYYFQFYSNKLFGRSMFSDPMELFLFTISFLSLLFLIGIIWTLYKGYKETRVIETLLFLLSMISFLIAGVLGSIERISYSTWGSPQLGDLIHIIVLFPMQFSFLCVNTFAIRITFPEKFKIIISFLIVLSTILITIITWAMIQGPPYAIIINFAVVHSNDVAIVVLATLAPVAVMPLAIFFYSAKKIRDEDRPKSNRSFWFGMGFLFFTLGAGLTTPTTPYFAIFSIFAAFTLYICFKMPNWFKRRIGWTE